MNKLVATFLYVGLLRPAPGTWGSAAAIPVIYLLHRFAGFPGVAMAGVAVFLIGWWATARYTRGTGIHDPSEVVIDEVAGMFVTLAPVSAGLWFAGVPGEVFPYPGWVAGFALFRLFDIWKPGPIGWADRRGDPLGVMLDDIIAGVFAAIIVLAMAAFSHLVLMA